MTIRFLALLFPVVVLTLSVGCEKFASPTSGAGNAVVSDGSITVSNGQVTEGRPVVSEEIEKEVYKSLNHRRKMMTAIKEKSGSSAGLQQMQDEFNLLSKGFMSRYGLSEAEIAKILEKGDSGNWE